MSRLATLAAGAWVVLAACGAMPSWRHEPAPPASRRAPEVAVLPFRTGGSLSTAGDLVPDAAGTALDGALGVEVARRLGARLASLGIMVRDPDVAAGAAELANTGRYGVGLARRVAERTRAEVAVIGTLIRYEQRDGTAWGVRSPASVEYQAALVRASDGVLLLVDRFAYTQQALSENLLALPRFLRGGGRWLTREELLDGALEETAEKMAKAMHVPVPAGSGDH